MPVVIPVAAEELRITGNMVTVLYGGVGSFKTTTALKLIKDKGILICADNSWQILTKEAYAPIRPKVDVVLYEGMSQLEYIDYSPYDTIILDPWNEMVDIFLDLLTDNVTWDGKVNVYPVTSLPELSRKRIISNEDWRVCRDKWRPVLEHLLAQNANLVVTAHVNEPMVGVSKDTLLRPNVPNKTWQLLNRRANLIGYINGKNIDFTGGNPVFVGKSQYDAITGRMPLDMFVQKYKEIAQ